MNVTTYAPGERDKWLRYEVKLLERMEQVYVSYCGDWKKTHTTILDELHEMCDSFPSEKDKIELHANNAAREFILKHPEVVRKGAPYGA